MNGAEALKKTEGEREAFWIEVDKLRKEGKVAKANLKEAKRENCQSKKEIEELWIGLVAQKKKK